MIFLNHQGVGINFSHNFVAHSIDVTFNAVDRTLPGLLLGFIDLLEEHDNNVEGLET